MVSANTASSEPHCYKKMDGSQNARIRVEGPQIYQMNRPINSIQIVCDMQ